LPIAVKVGGQPLAVGRFSVSGNTLTFLAANGTPEFVTGPVLAKYTYKEPGYNGSFVKDSVVDVYDEDAPTVIIDLVDDGSIDVIEGSVVVRDGRIASVGPEPRDAGDAAIDARGAYLLPGFIQ